MATNGMAAPYYISLVWLGAANSLFLFQSLRASIKRACAADHSVNEVSTGVRLTD